jgi:hypothetical protein
LTSHFWLPFCFEHRHCCERTWSHGHVW